MIGDGSDEAYGDAVRSNHQACIEDVLQLLWWLPLSPIVGFVLGSWILSESWPLRQVVPLAAVLAAPFAVGAFYGYSAIRHHDRTGWIGLVLHLTLMIVAFVMPISESVSN
jgi:hypothetical protein